MSFKFKLGIFPILFSVLSFSHADDIEIYQTSNTDKARNNVLMLLDSSGSLRTVVNGRTLKEQLDESLINLLTELPDDSYVGIGRYNHPGGSLLYPISRLGDEAESVKLLKLQQGEDDGYEKGNNGNIFRFTETLEFDSRLVTESFKIDRQSDHVEICSNGTGKFSSTSIIDIDYDTSGNNCGAERFYREMNGLYFRGLNTIPAGSGVSGARIGMTLYSDANGRSIGDILVENTNSPVEFDTMFDFNPENLLYERDYVKDFYGENKKIEWRVGSGETNDVLYTSNFAELLEPIIGSANWNGGNGNLNVVLQDGENAKRNRSQFYTYAFGGYDKSPELTIDYYDKNETKSLNEVGLRFENPKIPTNVDVTNARLIITPAGNSNYQPGGYIDIYLQDGSQPLSISDNNNDISSRGKEVYTHRHYFNNKPETDIPYSIDISELLEKKFKDSDWNPEDSDLFLILKTSHLDSIYSAESGQNKEPFIYFSHKAREESLVSRTFTYNIENNSDDAEETRFLIFNTVNTNSNSLEIENGKKLGLTFRNVDIPRIIGDLDITEAYIEVTSHSNSGTNSFAEIRIEDENNPDFFSTSNNISNRGYINNHVDWNINQYWERENKYRTPNIASLIKGVVSKDNWERGSDLSFSLTNTSGDKEFYSVDGAAGKSARLIIKGVVPSNDVGTTVRERLIDIVGEIPADGSTPIPGSLYEMYQYMQGKDVDFGRSRNFFGTMQTKRVSSDLTYVGGERYLPNYCSEDNLNSVYCINERITGNPVYISPMNQNSCETNHVILLTDGQPSAFEPDQFYAKSGNRFDVEVANITGKSCNGHLSCSYNLAEHMSSQDLFPNIEGKQSINTHVVAFNETDPQGNMKTLAEKGNGFFYTAFNSTDLVNKLFRIFDSIYDESATIVTPGVAVNNDNRFEYLNELYYSVFKPSQYQSWTGNVKKYKFDKNLNGEYKIFDKNNNVAIENGFFKESSQDFWSDEIDGNDASKGGAASNLELPRYAYTYTGENDPDNVTLGDNHKLVVDNNNIDKDLLDMNSADDDVFNVTRLWLMGYDVLDDDGDGVTNEVRKRMGSALHSRPILVTYGNNNNTVFVTTNEGFLHAVDAETGQEIFSFMPPEFLREAQYRVANEPGDLLYGWDSSLIALKNDSNKNGVIDPNTEDFVYLYGGMRRGGNFYYALDVTNATKNTKNLSNKILFKIYPKAGTPFEEMGQTWSEPVISKIRINEVVIPVMIFSGGYDTLHDDNTINSYNDTFGNQLYMVNALTGDLVWWASNEETSADVRISGMDFSIPAKPAVIDSNKDGFVDNIYVGDLGGQLLRFDIDNINSTNSSNLASGKIIAKLGKTDGSVVDSDFPEKSYRRLYESPAVALMQGDGANYNAVLFGSGYRAHPLNEQTNEKVYVLKDYEAINPGVSQYEISSPIRLNDLANVTTVFNVDSANTLVNSKDGWYINLGYLPSYDGEKVLGEPVIFNGKAIFTTYIPNVNTETCGVSPGKSVQYSVDIRNGSAQNGSEDFEYGDRVVIDNITGITSGTKIIYTENGNKVLSLTNTELNDMGIQKGTGLFRDEWYKLQGESVNEAFEDIQTIRE